jgi:hypothetical protein
MKCLRGLFMSAVPAIILATSALGQVQTATLTCGQFRSFEPEEKDAAAAAFLEWVVCDEACTIAGSLAERTYGMSVEEARQLIEDRCLGQPPETRVVDRLAEGT